MTKEQVVTSIKESPTINKDVCVIINTLLCDYIVSCHCPLPATVFLYFPVPSFPQFLRIVKIPFSNYCFIYHPCASGNHSYLVSFPLSSFPLLVPIIFPLALSLSLLSCHHDNVCPPTRVNKDSSPSACCSFVRLFSFVNIYLLTTYQQVCLPISILPLFPFNPHDCLSVTLCADSCFPEPFSRPYPYLPPWTLAFLCPLTCLSIPLPFTVPFLLSRCT